MCWCFHDTKSQNLPPSLIIFIFTFPGVWHSSHLISTQTWLESFPHLRNWNFSIKIVSFLKEAVCISRHWWFKKNSSFLWIPSTAQQKISGKIRSFSQKKLDFSPAGQTHRANSPNQIWRYHNLSGWFFGNPKHMMAVSASESHYDLETLWIVCLSSTKDPRISGINLITYSHNYWR